MDVTFEPTAKLRDTIFTTIKDGAARLGRKIAKKENLVSFFEKDKPHGSGKVKINRARCFGRN